MFKVYFINHDYYADGSFGSVQSALDYAQSKSFEAAIHQKLGPDTLKVVAAWSPLTGTTWF